VPTPNQRWKTRVPSVNARTRSERTLVLRRRQYSALYPRTVNNAFAGRSPFTAFIRVCELSMGVQRMIAPFKQTVLLEVLRREPAPLLLDPFDTHT
jgi:hypothetical protein